MKALGGDTRTRPAIMLGATHIHAAVRDNGKGLTQNSIPPSLERRARLIGGQASATTPDSGGILMIRIQIPATPNQPTLKITTL